jgi:hypothetical protein
MRLTWPRRDTQHGYVIYEVLSDIEEKPVKSFGDYPRPVNLVLAWVWYLAHRKDRRYA